MNGDGIVIDRTVGTGDAAALIGLLDRLGWGTAADYTEEGVHTMLRNAAGVWIARDSAGRVVGYARALSDGVLATFLAELVVDPAHQGRGIGSALLAAVIDTFHGTAIYADALAGTEGFFAARGLRPRSGRLVACSRAPG